jgi:hypothetical protein
MADKSKSRKSSQKISSALDALEEVMVIERIPSDSVYLTEEERRFLDDPNWITEDEADVIISERIMRREGGKAKDIRQYLKERGIEMES